MKRHHHAISNSNNEYISHSTTNSSTPWWSRLCDEFRAEGGHVAEHVVQFDRTTRELRAGSLVLPDSILLQIPLTCMVTQESALQHYPWLSCILEKEDIDFYHSKVDIMIAMFLAIGITITADLPYLQCLPNPSTLDALPRRWDEDDLKKLLGYTSIYQRVVAARVGTRRDYNMIKSLVPSTGTGQSPSQQSQQPTVLPSYPVFDDMLAVVTSRAFQIGESTVALVVGDVTTRMCTATTRATLVSPCSNYSPQ
jgi:hypothetical protein